MLRRSILLILFFIIPGLFVAGCEPDDQSVIEYKPVAFESGDECHLCGMIITRFPGPKGEAFLRHNEKVFKFCSTQDLFAWLLQPDVSNRVEAVFVHDMAKTAWDDPEDVALIDARMAWYVTGSERRGAMGATLASFAGQDDAFDFSKQYGGTVIRFEDIDLKMLQ